MARLLNLHTWLADRVRWIEHPRLRRMPKTQTSNLSWVDKGLVLLVCLPLLIASLFGMAFGAFLLYVIIGSFF